MCKHKVHKINKETQNGNLKIKDVPRLFDKIITDINVFIYL